MTTEHKVIGGIGLLTLVIFAGGIFLMSRQDGGSIPQEQVVTRNGLHWHPKLTILINGKKQEIPPNIGLGAVHQKIHTHDEDAKDGVVHMEMQGVVTKDDTKLGNFFRIWGKEFNKNSILGNKNGPAGTVKMIVNGKENLEFENYLMKDKDVIEIKYE